MQPILVTQKFSNTLPTSYSQFTLHIISHRDPGRRSSAVQLRHDERRTTTTTLRLYFRDRIPSPTNPHLPLFHATTANHARRRGSPLQNDIYHSVAARRAEVPPAEAVAPPDARRPPNPPPHPIRGSPPHQVPARGRPRPCRLRAR